MTRLSTLVGVLVPLALAAPSFASDVLVLDRAGKSVARLDSATLVAKGTAALPDVPTRIVVSPDGKTVIILCRGEGEQKYDGFRAKTMSQAVVLDTETMKERARVELGWGLGPALWDATGANLVVLAGGYPSTNPEKRQRATVVSIGLDGTARRVSIDRGAIELAVSADGSAAAVLSPRVEGPAALFFCDFATKTATAPVMMEGEPEELLVAPDGVTLYSIARGKQRGFGNVQGILAVFSFSERKLIGQLKLGAITGIGGFEKNGRLILGGARAGEVKEHRITIVKGTAVEHSVVGPKAPVSFLFSPDGRTALVLGTTSAIVDFGDFSSPPAVAVFKMFGGGLGGLAFERTPDGKLGLVYAQMSENACEVAIYDLPAGTKRKSFDTASFGSRLVAGLAAGAATISSIDSGRREAQARGQSTYMYSIYTVKTQTPRGTPLVIRPDGKVAFVYNPMGNDVLSIDLEKLEKGKRQNAGKGSRGLFLTGGGRTLLVASEKGLSVFDTTLFGEPVVTKTDGPADIAMGPSGEALLFAKGLVAVIDPATGKVGPQSAAFKEPAIGTFLP